MRNADRFSAGVGLSQWIGKARQSAASRANADADSLLAGDLIAFGSFHSTDPVYVHGRITGNICAPHIFICDSGLVKGDIFARDARISGQLVGRAFAIEVAVDATAFVDGQLFHHNITVARGAQLDGRMPWRPVSYFENVMNDFQGDHDEYVFARG